MVIDGKYHREALIGEVVTVAKDSGAYITLLSILDAPPDDHEMSGESSDLHRWIEEDHLEQRKYISSELVERGIQVTSKHCNGKPYL